jgi:hypothetical protein
LKLPETAVLPVLLRTAKVLPCTGPKPLSRVVLRAPAREMGPETASWSYWLPAARPLRSMLRAPAEVCV